MSLWKLALHSLHYFWRTNLALLLGIAVGTAVLTGALIVGDSIRGSLKMLTIERLGRIDEILIGELFFRRELAEQLHDAIKSDAGSPYDTALPAILVNQATAELDGSDNVARAQGVTVVGAEAGFWELRANGEAPPNPASDQIIINQSLADELGAKIGDRLILRLGKPPSVATDSPLARKSDLVKSLVDLELIDIIPATGLGRFSLQASQQVPFNAFVSLATLQDGLDLEDRANAILVAGKNADQTASDEAFDRLRSSVQASISDLGLELRRITLNYQQDGVTKTVLEYDTLTNARMLFDPVQDELVSEELKQWQAQPVFTYVATKMKRLDSNGQPEKEVVAYSTITGIDSVDGLGPLTDDTGANLQLREDEIVLNEWAAGFLHANVGDKVRVTYFQPETTHGEVDERSEDFVVRSITRITSPKVPFSPRRPAEFDKPPTLANDPDLTPQVKGITDAESIDKWDAPFPMDRGLIAGRDDEYWRYFRTTPKAFISRAASRRLWKSRFGTTSSYRIPVSEADVATRGEQLSASLGPNYEKFGMHWVRAKQDGLAASKGTTPFDALFFGFSQFIIASALMLVSLLLRLSMEQRAAQVGLVGALGFRWNRSLRLLLAEHAAIVFLGGIAGVFLGIGYAWLMVAGLRTWWVNAVATPFIQLFVTPRSLTIGFLLGFIAALATIVWTLRRLKQVSTTQLMAGKTEEPQLLAKDVRRRPLLQWIPLVLVGLAILLGIIAPTLPPEPQGGAFFGSGACVLVALLMCVAGRLKHVAAQATSGGDLSLNSLAARNLTRNPTRSTLTIGLVAAACFLIVAISAFRLAPTEGGTGGFELVGQSNQPIFELRDHNADAKLFPLRMQDGDDASCRNLYQSSRPRLIGITPDFVSQASMVGKMNWAGVDGRLLKGGTSEWNVLLDADPSDAIPVVLDKNTAMYGMQIYTGVGTEFERDYGTAGVLKFRIVGLLGGSIFQGSMLIPEQALLRHFPRVGGYRYFLVDTNDDPKAIARELEDRFSDEGLDLADSSRLLAELLAVQNTYLSTFQSLGGLGLLLGTLGLAAVQLRNVVQRRSELALLRATGFRNDQLSLLILREHAMLLFGGLAVGIVAAFVVIFPHMLFGGASVPLFSLAITLGLVAIVGLASALFAQRYLQKMPLLASLRAD